MIRQAVQEYDHSDDALDHLETLVGDRQALVLHGRIGYEKVLRVNPELASFPTVAFRGECSDEEVTRLSAYEPDVWIAIGGGKLIDTAKRVASRQGVPLLVIPTLVSNCAAFTPLSVMYTEDGQYVRYDTFRVVIERVLVDSRVLRHSPYPYFKAGLIDTVAKWYEARFISGTSSVDAGVNAGLALAEPCGRLVDLTISPEAFNEYGTDVRFAVDHILAIGGAVGGFGDAGTRVAVAHAVHNALSHFESTHEWLHGDKVGFGLIVQERLRKSFDAPYLELWLASIGAPTTLEDLGLDVRDIDRLATYIEEETALQQLGTELNIHYLKNILENLQTGVYK